MTEETALWAWLLFESGLGRAKAKALLDGLGDEGGLRARLREVAADPASWGLTRAEAARLRPPATLSSPTALRWETAGYPAPLRRLPRPKRPALIFYRGDAALLRGPLFLFTDAPAAEEERLAEAVALLLDEVLPAAPWGSEAAERLLAEMGSTGGVAVLFVRQGLATFAPPPQVEALIEAGRLLLLSFLPPDSPPNPRWRALLAETEAAAAEWLVHAGAEPPDLAPLPGTRAFWLRPPEGSAPPAPWEALEEAAMLLAALPAPSASSPSPSPETAPPETTEPPLPPEEVLALLGRGGRVPEKLRRRLLEERHRRG